MKTNNTWIDVRAGLDDLVLQEYHQPCDALTQLSEPSVQCPQMIMLIGSEYKRHAFDSLGFGASTSDKARDDVRLFIDKHSTKSPSPYLYADCELHSPRSFGRILAGPVAGDVTRRPLIWRKQNLLYSFEPIDLANLVYAKLLSPFSTVICLFADDFNSLNTIARTLASWLNTMANRPSDLPYSTRPQVLILKGSSIDFDEEKETKSFLLQLERDAEQLSGFSIESTLRRPCKSQLREIIAAQFSGIRVLATPSKESNRRSWITLRSAILKASDDVHMQRQRSNVAFSAIHFKSLFHTACDHFCNNITTPFSFIQASRIPNPVSELFSQHFTDLLRKIDSPFVYQFAVPTIASALALDSFPPDMHFFTPELVFECLYRRFLQNVPVRKGTPVEEGYEMMQLTNAVQHRFCQTVTDANEGKITTLSSHQNVLFTHRAVWASLFSNTTCFACLARRPENSLKCGHALCDHCTTLHGLSTPETPWTLKVECCPLCGLRVMDTIKMKPPTAGVRVLSIDGGGVRGISSIGWLKQLQSTLRLPMPVQDHFDIAIGTSSGALTILGLFINSWSPEKCDQEFIDFAQLAFQGRLPFKIPFLHSEIFQKAKEIFFSLIMDSQYGSKGISKAVKSAFGNSLTLFKSSSNAKIAITGTTTDTSSTVIFSNYNGDERPQGCGYSIFRPEDPQDEILTWEAARVTSAAPPFFGPYRGYHDGGLGGHNNPVNLGLWEQNLIWQRKNKQPDAVVSIGTGSSITNTGDKEGSWVSQLFLPRLIRSFMTLLDGQKTWIDLINSIPPQHHGRYHRLNVSFQGQEPQIDEIESMRAIKQQVDLQATSKMFDLKKCADTLIASLFYLELKAPPQFNKVSFNCQGKILCRLGAGTRELHAVVVQLRDQQSRFYLTSQDYVSCVDRMLYDQICRGEPYVRAVEFQILSLTDEIDFKVDGITQRPRSISNCPYSVSDLQQDQMFHFVFGRPDHKRRADILQSPKRRADILQSPAKRRRY